MLRSQELLLLLFLTIQRGIFIGSVTKGLNIPVVSISKKSGEMVKRQIRSKQRNVQFIYKKEQDQLADFSSKRPVYSELGY